MEPDRPIEKLLRAFAKKRREDAGAPLQMHSATRKLLHDEIARRAKESDRVATFSWWSSLRAFQRVGIGLGFVAVLFVCAALFLPGLLNTNREQRTAKSRAEVQIASANNAVREPLSKPEPAQQRAAPPAVPEEKRPGIAPSLEQLDAADSTVKTRSEKDLADRKLQVAKQSSDSQKTTATSDLSGLSGGGGGSAGQRFDEPKLALNENRLAGSSSTANEPEAAPAGQATIGGLGAAASIPSSNETGAAYRLAFQNTAPQKFARVSDESPSTGLPVSAPNILESFAIQREGSSIQIVDYDGSVYSGVIHATDAAALGLAKNDAILESSVADSPGGLEFSVSGTNRTLNAEVTFAGRIVAVTNKISTSNSPPPVTISGAVEIGSRKIEIRATSVPQ